MPKQKKTPDGLPKIEQLPSGTYRCRVYLGEDENGKKIQKSMTNRDRNELIMDVLRLQKQHAEEKDMQRRGMCTLTVAEAMDEQLRNKSHIWSPSTIKRYTRTCKSRRRPRTSQSWTHISHQLPIK